MQTLGENVFEFGHIMNFTLTYRGRLPSGQETDRAAHKKTQMEMRRSFHAQLARQWRSVAALRRYFENAFKFPVGDSDVPLAWSHHTVAKFDFDFVPLVVTGANLKLICELDMRILWRNDPGSILTRYGGDIDNRIKPLFDALSLPNADQLPAGEAPKENEIPFFCLLEDDRLITRISIGTEQLLLPASDTEPNGYAELSIAVTVEHSRHSVASVRI
jgi:hypothetical protein